KYVDRFNFIFESSNSDDQFFVPVQRRIDMGVSYSSPKDRVILAVNINNITNDELFDNFKVPRPGRNYNLRIIYKFNNF
ncbi:MAG: hypothetical protein WBA74_22315, partial [Cyclobacteriaceae bacterium]